MPTSWTGSNPPRYWGLTLGWLGIDEDEDVALPLALVLEEAVAADAVVASAAAPSRLVVAICRAVIICVVVCYLLFVWS